MLQFCFRFWLLGVLLKMSKRKKINHELVAAKTALITMAEKIVSGSRVQEDYEIIIPETLSAECSYFTTLGVMNHVIDEIRGHYWNLLIWDVNNAKPMAESILLESNSGSDIGNHLAREMNRKEGSPGLPSRIDHVGVGNLVGRTAYDERIFDEFGSLDDTAGPTASDLAMGD